MAARDRPRVEYRTPVDLVNEVKSGLIRMPPFQRGFKWEAGDVVRLFDSLVRGYPIGNLLVWRRPATCSACSRLNPKSSSVGLRSTSLPCSTMAVLFG
jgi:hypothetical protein